MLLVLPGDGFPNIGNIANTYLLMEESSTLFCAVGVQYYTSSFRFVDSYRLEMRLAVGLKLRCPTPVNAHTAMVSKKIGRFDVISITNG